MRAKSDQIRLNSTKVGLIIEISTRGGAGGRERGKEGRILLNFAVYVLALLKSALHKYSPCRRTFGATKHDAVPTHFGLRFWAISLGLEAWSRFI